MVLYFVSRLSQSSQNFFGKTGFSQRGLPLKGLYCFKKIS